MGGLDGIFLCISVDYKTLVLFGQTVGNRMDFNKWKFGRDIILNRDSYRRKWMQKEKHEICLLSIR